MTIQVRVDQNDMPELMQMMQAMVGAIVGGQLVTAIKLEDGFGVITTQAGNNHVINGKPVYRYLRSGENE